MAHVRSLNYGHQLQDWDENDQHGLGFACTLLWDGFGHMSHISTCI